MAECLNCGREAGINQIFCDDVCYKNAHGIGDEPTPLEKENSDLRGRLEALRGQVVTLVEANNGLARENKQLRDQLVVARDQLRRDREATVRTLWKN